jgi:hypothetical protein
VAADQIGRDLRTAGIGSTGMDRELPICRGVRQTGYSVEYSRNRRRAPVSRADGLQARFSVLVAPHQFAIDDAGLGGKQDHCVDQMRERGGPIVSMFSAETVVASARDRRCPGCLISCSHFAPREVAWSRTACRAR